MVGTSLGPDVCDIDERWTMAYAAAIDDHLDCYFNTVDAPSVVAHPIFPVCVEWPIIVRSRELSAQYGITLDEVRRSVHATHDLTINRLIRPGDKLSTTLTIAGIERRKPGTFSLMRLETTDADGNVVATTEQGGMYLGVDAAGDDRPATPTSPPFDFPDTITEPRAEIPVPIGAGAAHTYSECARIWNPIHTDAAVAAAAGLPAIILHGTATLGYAVSKLVELEADSDPHAVRRVACRFRSMVLMSSTITVRSLDRQAGGDGTDVVLFDVRTESGGPAIDHGVIVLG